MWWYAQLAHREDPPVGGERHEPRTPDDGIHDLKPRRTLWQALEQREGRERHAENIEDHHRAVLVAAAQRLQVAPAHTHAPRHHRHRLPPHQHARRGINLELYGVRGPRRPAFAPRHRADHRDGPAVWGAAQLAVGEVEAALFFEIVDGPLAVVHRLAIYLTERVPVQEVRHGLP